MKLTNINSRIAFNTVMARFAPTQSGKMAYFVEDKSFTIFAVEQCDHCGRDVQGANSITLVNPRQFVIEGLHARKVLPSLIEGELGCTEDGDAVCPECWAKANDKNADEILLDVGEGGAG
jgi:hypothetical protein